MNTKLKYLLASFVSALLLGGCCTSRHAKEWEYKVVGYNNANTPNTPETQQAFLNDQGKQGWIFVQNEGGWFYFKRAR